MITEKEVKIFIEGVKYYFATISDNKASVGTPYLVEPDQAPTNDLMGVINITGARRGKVYFSAARAMLRHILLSIGEKEADAELIEDIVGEVANTISGNVREFFGSQFVISIPSIFEGRPQDMQYPPFTKAFSIPVRWKSYTAYLVVCLE